MEKMPQFMENKKSYWYVTTTFNHINFKYILING